MKLTILALLVYAVFVLSDGISPPPAYALTITVNSTADDTDNDGDCTLREAIIAANTDTTSGTAAGECAAGSGEDTIEFDIDAATDVGCVAGTGVCTIQPVPQPFNISALPNITGPVTIDGYSQPGSSANTNPISQGSNAVLKIELDGINAGYVMGLRITERITAGDPTIKGLVIKRFGHHGIDIRTDGNNIEGNFILANGLGNGPSGVNISGASNNTIGGTTAAARNVISGNDRGVTITGSRATGNMVQGNYIGTDATGTVDLGNSLCGVMISQTANNNTIRGNVISGNNTHGVCISYSSGNEVKGNFIGTNAAGDLALGNLGVGVLVNGAWSNTIGGSVAGEGNVISGNGAYGIAIHASNRVGRNASMNVVQGNFIGTNADGTIRLPNLSSGIIIIAVPRGDPGPNPSAVGNIIGGTAAGEGNIIAFNTGNGVVVDGHDATDNSIRGNSIHGNDGQGINFLNGPNDRIKPPTVADVSPAGGKTCKRCEVDVFSDDADEGRIFEGTVLADARGNWTFVGAVTGPNITATATDADGNTSEFSGPLSGPLGEVICSTTWPVVTVNTIAKGQSPTNNAKVSHAITGNIVGGTDAYGPTASLIEICEGTDIDIEIKDSTGTPVVTGDCGPTASCTITAASFTATKKYETVSEDGKDTDSVTLVPIP